MFNLLLERECLSKEILRWFKLGATVREGIVDPILAKRYASNWCDACQETAHLNCEPFKPLQVLKLLFNVAARSDARDDNRVVMYELVQQMKDEMGIDDLLDEGTLRHGNHVTTKSSSDLQSHSEIDKSSTANVIKESITAPIVYVDNTADANGTTVLNGMADMATKKKRKKRLHGEDVETGMYNIVFCSECTAHHSCTQLEQNNNTKKVKTDTVLPRPLAADDGKSLSESTSFATTKPQPSTSNVQEAVGSPGKSNALSSIIDTNSSSSASLVVNDNKKSTKEPTALEVAIVTNASAHIDISQTPQATLNIKRVHWNKSQSVRTFMKTRPVSVTPSPTTTSAPPNLKPVLKNARSGLRDSNYDRAVTNLNDMLHVISSQIDDGQKSKKKKKKHKKKHNGTALLANVVSVSGRMEH